MIMAMYKMKDLHLSKSKAAGLSFVQVASGQETCRVGYPLRKRPSTSERVPRLEGFRENVYRIGCIKNVRQMGQRCARSPPRMTCSVTTCVRHIHTPQRTHTFDRHARPPPCNKGHVGAAAMLRARNAAFAATHIRSYSRVRQHRLRQASGPWPITVTCACLA